MPSEYWTASRGLIFAYDGTAGETAIMSVAIDTNQSAAQTLVHEWTHIPWIADTNAKADPHDPNSLMTPPDTTGWFETADFVSKQYESSALYTKNAER